MTITYELGNSLYINVTNRCSNDCEFCVRNLRDDVNGKDNLWLEREPSIDEIKADLSARNLLKYDEIVFCGFGEPMERWEDVLNIAEWLKNMQTPAPMGHPLSKGGNKLPTIRINTNGHGNLIASFDITSKLENIVDVVSISLNAKSAAEYDKVCRSRYGEAAYTEMLEFVRRAAKYTQVILTVVDSMPPEDIEACRKIAEDLGVNFRIREFI